MKKINKFLFVFIFFMMFLYSTVYALSHNFIFDSNDLSFSLNGRSSSIMKSFDNKYNLKLSLNESVKDEEELIELSRKTTYLLLGGFNNKNETAEEYYNRREEYFNNASYDYYPKDKNSNSGYDESNSSYRYVVAATLAIPQLFNSYNELDIIYNSFGDIRITRSKDIVISTVILPDVEMKKENSSNGQLYDVVKTNLINTYYFIEIDGEYRLTYLYGETTDDLNSYFNELEENENSNVMAMSTSYKSKLSGIYNFSKVNDLSEDVVNRIYNDNIKNIVYLKSYYNNQIISSSNGFFICDGIILTTWKFLEDSLKSGQFIVIRDSQGNTFDIDGIITGDINSDIALIKLKEKNGNYIKINSVPKVNIEDAAITLSSKTGVGLIIQKGIIIKDGDFIETSIPLSLSDSGSPLFNSNGNLIGFNSSKSINSSISMAVSSKILLEVQNKFKDVDFNTIKTISFEDLKNNFYYSKYNDEKIVKNIPKLKWNNFKKIGDIESNIKLELVKANYEDNIVSLRYKNNISDYLSSMNQAIMFTSKLVNDGYENILSTSKKSIYKNKKYKVIIRDEGDYLIIVMVKL